MPHPTKIRQNPSKIDAQSEAQKKHFFLGKSDAWDCSWVNGFGAKSGPKWHPKIIKNSIPKKYVKMMAKGLKIDGKWSRNGIQNHEKSADPRRVKALIGGGLPPPYPLHLGPLAAKVGPESSIRTLYVYWGLTLVRMDQILRRGVYSELWAPCGSREI